MSSKPKPKPVSKLMLARKGLEVLKTQDMDAVHGFEYGYFDVTGNHFKTDNHACHADVENWKNVAALYTFTPRPMDRTNTSVFRRDNNVFSAYVDWLQRKSPWRIAGVKSNTPPGFAAERGFLILDAELPANLVVNFCIATRVPNEHWKIAARWFDLVNCGVNPNVAFVFAAGLVNGNSWRRGDSVHFPLDVATISKATAENFVKGVVKHPSQPLSKNGNYLPCNRVWGGENKDEYWRFIDKTYPEVKSDDPKVPGGRVFRVASDYCGFEDPVLTRPREQWVEIALSESKRIVHGKAA